MTAMHHCRACHSDTKEIMSFGRMPLANAFLKQEDIGQEYFFEMKVAICPTCFMFQLVDQPDPSMMFHGNYAFFSSTSHHMAKHFETMANTYMNDLMTDPDPFIVELGSNDGIMLKHVAKKGIRHLGIEPSSNVAEVAKRNGVNTISKFFNEETAKEVRESSGPADVICCSNVMCHIPDLHSVAKGVVALLKPTGVFVFEDPYLGDVIDKTSYDQIYDEHVYLFSVTSVSNMFAPYGLEVFHVEHQTTHGGSMRYYLCQTGQKNVKDSVTRQREKEKEIGLSSLETFETFKLQCERSRQELVDLLKKLKQEGHRVVGYAATSKSTTVLNYCGIGPDLIEYICDTTPIKHDTASPGMHIPIRPYEHFQKDNPDYAVLFAWNHKAEVMDKEKSKDIQWITFVPQVGIVNG